MASQIDRMILGSVRCLTCGAAYGECDCAEKHRRAYEAKKAAFIEAEYERLMSLPDDEFIAECEKVGIKAESRKV